LSPALKTTPDRELIERWQTRGDADAREVLVERYRGLVRALAARYVDRGEPFDDLVQVAWIGLLKSIDRFDSSRDVQLTTYATPTIVGEIKRLFVHPAARGRGIERILLRGLEERGVQLGFEELRLDTDGGAAAPLALFRSAGFDAIADYNGNPLEIGQWWTVHRAFRVAACC